MDKKSALILSAIILVYCVFALLQPRDAFWITDGGNKFIQMRSFIKNGLDGFTVDYPAGDLDPERRFFPYGAHHFQKINGKIFSFYSMSPAPFDLRFTHAAMMDITIAPVQLEYADYR
jgi:hypothetical protein